MHRSKILLTEFVTHDVKRFILEKPNGYKFTPGQATDVAIGKSGWEDKLHPFTFTSLNTDKVLEFTIKGYPVDQNPNHKGMTEKLHTLVPGDELLIDNPWGTIQYKGKGVFIAGGAGVTPFIAIFRQLAKEGKIKGNKFIYSNKTSADVIIEKELREYFGDELTLTLTQEKVSGYQMGRITAQLLKSHFDPSLRYYVCGPKAMVVDIKQILNSLGAKSESVVFEE